MRTKQKSAFADRKMLGRAIKDSFVKLSPKTQAKNPVMFLVFVSAILTSILWVVSLFGLKDAPSGYTLAIAIILWFTVLFANFAEAIAEGRGKAQADSLRASRKDVDAHKIPSVSQKDSVTVVPSALLKKGELVIVKAGEQIPADGEVIEGAASVDESAITGESAPVGQVNVYDELAEQIKANGNKNALFVVKVVLCGVTNDIANDYSVTDSHDMTDASVLNDSHDVTSIDNSAQTVDSHDVASTYTTESTAENAANQQTADDRKFDQFLQALTGITIDAPEPAPGESLFDSVLGKVVDIVSGKNSDLDEINAAYTGLSATPQEAATTYDLSELEKALMEQQAATTAPEAQQPEASSVATPASTTPAAVEPAPLNVQPDAPAAAQEGADATKEITKRIILEIVGNGSVVVSGGSGGGMSEKAVLELLTNNIKPVLMGVIKDEIFEEGQLSYDY